jgi:hypothetical protein
MSQGKVVIQKITLTVASEHTLSVDASGQTVVKIQLQPEGGRAAVVAQLGSVAIGRGLHVSASGNGQSFGIVSGDLVLGGVFSGDKVVSHANDGEVTVTGASFSTPKEGEGTVLIVPPGTELIIMHAEPVTFTPEAIAAGIKMADI